MNRFIIITIVITGFVACKTQQHAIKENKGTMQYQVKPFTGTTLLDTINYLQTEVIDKKAQFIGKELHVLLKSIDIKPISYSYGIIPINISISDDISLRFYSANESGFRTYKKLPNTDLIIKWQTPLPSDSVFAIRKKSGGWWNQDAINYYDKQIIGDIILGKYNIKN